MKQKWAVGRTQNPLLRSPADPSAGRGALNGFHVEALLADRWGRNRILGDRTVAEGLGTSRTAASNNGTSDAAAGCDKILAAPNATSPGDRLSNQRYRWRHHFS